MAIYHLSVKVHSRSSGRSSVQSAAYRAGEKLKDLRRNETFNYAGKSVAFSRVLLPDAAPPDYGRREVLWNSVEASETRCDAQVCREVEIALPVELSFEAQKHLTLRYVQEQFVNRGMIADVVIHTDNPDNPHAHVLLTTREVGPAGFGRKNRNWNARAVLQSWRVEWARIANRALEREGHSARIDDRSHIARDIPLLPGRKLGPAAAALGRTRLRGTGRRDEVARARLNEQDAIVAENERRLLKHPELLFDLITQQRATFTEADLSREIAKNVPRPEGQQAICRAALKSDALLPLGKSRSGTARYSCQSMLDAERALLAQGTTLRDRAHLNRGHAVPKQVIEAVARKFGLRPEQDAAYREIVGSARDISLVEGLAGSGKSFMLGVAHRAWISQGYRVLGATLSSKAADVLESESGISSRSLAWYVHRWRHGEYQLKSSDIFVVDEAAMVGTRQLGGVLEMAASAGAKVVLVGDAEQLQAIDAGAPFRLLAERLGTVRMEDTRRQKTDWQRSATKDLASGIRDRVEAAIDRYGTEGFVHAHESRNAAARAMVDAWAKLRLDQPEVSQLMLAYRRADVAALNGYARRIAKDAGWRTGPDVPVQALNGNHERLGTLEFSVGDRVYFLKNDNGLGVRNGTLGTVARVDTSGWMAVTLDPRPGQTGKAQTVCFDTNLYRFITHGYAATVHKSQGATVDRAQVLASGAFDRHAAYVALTRHRVQVDLHYSQDEFASRHELLRQLSRARKKDMVLDYLDAREARAAAALKRGSPAGPDAKLNPTVLSEDEAKQLSEEYATLEGRLSLIKKRSLEEILETFSEVVRARRNVHQALHAPGLMRHRVAVANAKLRSVLKDPALHKRAEQRSQADRAAHEQLRKKIQSKIALYQAAFDRLQELRLAEARRIEAILSRTSEVPRDRGERQVSGRGRD